MEKRTGWGTEYADDIRNGEWEYQAFKADKTVNDKANAEELLHLPQAAMTSRTSCSRSTSMKNAK